MRVLVLAAVLAVIAVPAGLTPFQLARGVQCYEPGVHHFVLTAARLTLEQGTAQDTFDLEGPTTVLAVPVGDTDGDGLQELQTEILEFQLVGFSAVFGVIKLSESPVLASMGQVEENAPGTCFPATSYFDVFVQSELPAPTHNHVPAHMVVTLDAIPPTHGTSYGGPPTPIPLYVGPSHPETVPGEVEVARITHAAHTPGRIFTPSNPACNDGVDNDLDGAADYPEDDGCASPQDDSEQATVDNCPHSSPHSHSYGSGGSAGARSDTASAGRTAGVTTVSDANTVDCDGNGEPGDSDGDYETGVGGGFFGFGPWADEPLCRYGLKTHGASVTVSDVVHGGNVAFVIGADDTGGPAVDPVTGACSTDGSITPGDPATDPTADADDCLTDVHVGSGATCGAGGDGGYWVFLSGVFVDESSGSVTAGNPPTAGTLTA